MVNVGQKLVPEMSDVDAIDWDDTHSVRRSQPETWVSGTLYTFGGLKGYRQTGNYTVEQWTDYVYPTHGLKGFIGIVLTGIPGGEHKYLEIYGWYIEVNGQKIPISQTDFTGGVLWTSSVQANNLDIFTEAPKTAFTGNYPYDVFVIYDPD
jgi:hypothetical protein